MGIWWDFLLEEDMNVKIAVAGTGCVGLIIGVCLTECGHSVYCIGVDENKYYEIR